MSNPFDQFDAPTAQGANPFDQFDAPAPNPATTAAESGTLLPLTRYQDGHVGFDSNAGVFGMAKSAYRGLADAVNLTGETAKGNVDLSNPETMAAAVPIAAGAASLATPMAPGAGLLSTGLQKVAVPTADALHAAGNVARGAARDLGVDYASPAVADMARSVQDVANSNGALSVLAPQAHALLNGLQAVPAGASAVPFGNLDAARMAFGRLAQNFGPDAGHERYVAGMAKDAIDKFVTAADPATVAAGPAADAGALVRDAIGDQAAGFRSDRLNGIERAADLRSSAANSGMNIGNTTRQKVTSLLLDDKQSSGFNPAEIGALEDVVHGSMAANALRKSANMLGGGGGLGHSLAMAGGAGIGAHLGGEAGAMVGGGLAGAVGPALKAGQNALDTGALSAVDEMVRQRSPLFAAARANAPQVVNVGQTALNAGARPLSQAFMLNGTNSSLGNAPPGSRQSDLNSVLTGAHPALGSAFQ